MKRVIRLFLTLSAVTGLAGVIVFWFNDLAGCAACGLGSVFLLLAYLCEKLSPKPAQYRRNELSTRKNSMGILEMCETTLWVSSTTAFEGKRTCAELGNVDGAYTIELEEKFKEDICFVSKVRIRLEGGPSRGFQHRGVSIVVDTGVLCFLTAEGRTAWPDRRLEGYIMDELTKAGPSPLRLWLANEKGIRAGFLVSTGEGDGVYEVKTGSEDGRIVSVAVRFMQECL